MQILRPVVQKFSMRDWVDGVIVFTAVCCLPLYLWDSGGMQISHILLAIFFATSFFSNQRELVLVEQLFVALVVYSLCRESISIFSGAQPEFLLSTAYLLFAFLIFNSFRRNLNRRAIFIAMQLGLVVAALIAVLGVLLFGYSVTLDDDGGRSVGTFNNPNQLGYFSVCIFAIAFLLFMRRDLGRIVLIVLILCSLFLAIVSLSKAALMSIGIGALFAGFSLSRSRGSWIFGFAVLVSLFVGFGVLYQSGQLDNLSFVYRLQNIGADSDDSLEGRGYGIFEDLSADTLLFGFGSSEVASRVGHEVHSTIFNVVANYGFIGGALFISILLIWISKIWREFGLLGVILIVSPVMLYGLTHNGSRFTIFWIGLALTFADFRQDILLQHRNLRQVS